MYEPASDLMWPTEMGSKVDHIECTIHNIITYLDTTHLAMICIRSLFQYITGFMAFDVLDAMHDRAAHF